MPRFALPWAPVPEVHRCIAATAVSVSMCCTVAMHSSASQVHMAVRWLHRSCAAIGPAGSIPSCTPEALDRVWNGEGSLFHVVHHGMEMKSFATGSGCWAFWLPVWRRDWKCFFSCPIACSVIVHILWHGQMQAALILQGIPCLRGEEIQKDWVASITGEKQQHGRHLRASWTASPPPLNPTKEPSLALWPPRQQLVEAGGREYLGVMDATGKFGNEINEYPTVVPECLDVDSVVPTEAPVHLQEAIRVTGVQHQHHQGIQPWWQSLPVWRPTQLPPLGTS
uniref:Uncharacterized protein n=1 Tax=Sphaerodactylus townsendi TaxID=933632 RepID=A0ACB8FU49_9SAUR